MGTALLQTLFTNSLFAYIEFIFLQIPHEYLSKVRHFWRCISLLSVFFIFYGSAIKPRAVCL